MQLYPVADHHPCCSLFMRRLLLPLFALLVLVVLPALDYFKQLP